MSAGRWKLGRGRGSIRAQLPLAICMMLAIVVLLLGRAEASIFDNARAKVTDFGAPALAAIQRPIAAVQRWSDGIFQLFAVHNENLRLREEIDQLRRWRDVAFALEQRVSRYESLLNAVPDPDLPSVTAQVIGQASQPFTKTVILDVGTRQNVQKGQAVLDDRGLLGRIFVAGENTSWVLLLTDLNSRIPVVIRPSNRRAMLLGNSSMSPALQLDSGDAQVRAGDRVYSTGDGGLIPPDLPIGMVTGEGEELRAALFADPDLSDYVQIIDYRADIEPPGEASELPISLFPAEPSPESEPAEIADESQPGNEVVLQ